MNINSQIYCMVTLYMPFEVMWTSMHNSAYDCDKKNLIAPLNSLGTLEIYHVIKLLINLLKYIIVIVF